MEPRLVKESRVVKTSIVLPPDTNQHGTMFGGKLMSYIDDVAALSATRHARVPVVTASTDSVDFLYPINPDDSVCVESFIISTGTSSMEVFVKVISEGLYSGERKIAATAFLTFVGLDENKRPVPVPGIIPETEEERKLHERAVQRQQMRKMRREESRRLAEFLTTRKPWE
jgi:acyl-CoA hydrolase